MAEMQFDPSKGCKKPASGLDILDVREWVLDQLKSVNFKECEELTTNPIRVPFRFVERGDKEWLS
jgi:hypothetical protein